MNKSELAIVKFNWQVQVSNQSHVRKYHMPLWLTIQSAFDCDWRSNVQGAKDPNAYTSQKLVSEATHHLASFNRLLLLNHRGTTIITSLALYVFPSKYRPAKTSDHLCQQAFCQYITVPQSSTSTSLRPSHLQVHQCAPVINKYIIGPPS